MNQKEKDQQEQHSILQEIHQEFLGEKSVGQTEEKLNFVCPFCQREVKENEEVFFDLSNKTFYHIECLKKEQLK